ncbi:MAG TPA: pyridoxal-phosphate dependent enzyme [Rickettsiales bacterium]|nr:pyridoxal-phosphate dependent enzyme [Rickettsiales bacterium]
MISFADIKLAHYRIKDFIKNTPIISNKILNQKLNAQVFFKCDNLQETLSFKARGAFNALLVYKEKYGEFPKKVVTVSSGNHAQAVAFACKEFGIEALIYMAKITSPLKIVATKSLGAQVIICERRADANQWSQEKINDGYYFIHPSANDDVISGNGTACLEALQEIGEVDAIFTPVGGGGLISGTYLVATKLSPQAKVFGCEPLNANDAALSVRDGKIFEFKDSPNTIADGARTLAVLPICFEYLKKLDGILEIAEEEILYWQKEFLQVTKVLIEPTSALALSGVAQYVQENSGKKILVIISGGNV